jgi:glycosyltransferase involved in cell wall biosynthesis
MKIIQIIDVRWYNACADFAVQQARALARAGHGVLLMGNPGSPPVTRAAHYGLEVSDEVNFASLNIFLSAGRLREIAERFEADVIFAHRGESHLIASLASRKIGFPVARFRGDVRSPRADIFSRILNERMTAGIAVSTQRLKLEYEKLYRLNGIPMRVIYPGVAIPDKKQERPKSELKSLQGLDGERPLVGIVGRLSPVKGHRYFLEAARYVQEENPDVQFVVAGGDAQITAKELEEHSRRIGLVDLHLPGHLDDINELISALDIGVIASVGSEMICRVMMEYFASGVAVVGTRVNQVEELGEISRASVLVPAGDARSLGEAILKLVRNRGERERLAERGREWVTENRSLQRLADESAAFLEQVINEHTVGNSG